MEKDHISARTAMRRVASRCVALLSQPTSRVSLIRYQRNPRCRHRPRWPLGDCAVNRWWTLARRGERETNYRVTKDTQCHSDCHSIRKRHDIASRSHAAHALQEPLVSRLSLSLSLLRDHYGNVRRISHD